MSPEESERGPVYCTKRYRDNLPPSVGEHFRDLDHLLRTLMSSAHDRLLLIAPYLSQFGMEDLRDSIAVSAHRRAWIRLVTGDLEKEHGYNRQAIKALVEGENGHAIRQRLRVLTPATDVLPLLHAKIVVVDSAQGYLGSANLSRSALESNFEVGVTLSKIQASSIDALIGFFEAQGVLREVTESVAN